MLNLINNEQMRAADVFTCKDSNISSVELMEKAVTAFVEVFTKKIKADRDITIFSGKGNNGGDGLAIARLLRIKGYKKVKIFILNEFNSETADFSINLERLKKIPFPLTYCGTVQDLDQNFDVVIDAILGSGFKGEIKTSFKALFQYINSKSNYIVSVDVPSGCNVEDFSFSEYHGIRAHLTISFQRPKLFFTFPESHNISKDFKFVPIGLSEDYIKSIASDYFWVDTDYIKTIIPKRNKFSHKGTYGHLLVYSGDKTKRGASLLTSKAALKTGVGLLTYVTEADFFPFVNLFQPEFMTLDVQKLNTSDLKKINTLVIGPGLGVADDSRIQVLNFLNKKTPLVLDADALNVLVKSDFTYDSDQKIIITPHMAEFDRLFGKHQSWYDRLQTAKIFAKEKNIVVVLKNQYTFICTPEGKVLINSTGNPAMAQGGMGDVLTGCIAAFLTRGLKPEDAAILGCYLHGYTADFLAEQHEVVSPSVLIDNLSVGLFRLIND